MDETILEKLLTKLIGLTEFGALRWHFAGDVSKAYVTVYKNSRLKLTENLLDITEAESETVRIDARLHSEILRTLINGLLKAARESSGRFRTGPVKVVSSASLTNACQRLLEDDPEISLCDCLVCKEKFDPEKTLGHITRTEGDKSFYICHECVNTLGVEEAQQRLERAVKGEKEPGEGEDPIKGETFDDLLRSPQPTPESAQTEEEREKDPERR